MISVVQKMLTERCGKRITVSEDDIELLQKKKLLLGDSHEEVVNIWKEISDRCPLMDSSTSSGSQKNIAEKFVFDEKLKNNTSPTNDICVAYAPNGSDI